MSEQFPAIIVVAPLVTSFVIFIAGWWNNRLSYPLVLAAMLICSICSVGILNSVMDHGRIEYWLGGWKPPWGIEYRVDHLNAFIIVLISALGLLAVVYAKKSVEKELPEKLSLFWSLYLLLMTGLLGISITGDLFNLFVLLEVASLAGYALVAIGQKKASVAGFRYLIIGTIGASFYLLGLGYIYISTGSLNMEDLRLILPSLYASRVVKAAFVFIFIGFAIKIALFPLHAWQPDVYSYAPSAVTVIISTAAAKTFCYALIRIIYSVFTLDFIKAFLPVFEIICWAAALAIVSGSIFAIVQDDLKRMLAYSSVANVGYIVLAIGLAPSSVLGLTPAIMHILNHAVIKASMFMIAGAFLYKLDLGDIKHFTGLGRKMPYSCLAFILAALAMIGMPPGAGFITKWYLILAALDAGNYIFVAVIFFSTLLMIVYFWRVIEIMYIRAGNRTGAKSVGRVQEAPLSMLLPGLSLGVLTFVLGVIWISGIWSPFLDAVNLNFGLGAAP
jgi:multicomponent Na+:H+ antiporter subunit D